MGCWEPIITDDQFDAWVKSFTERFGSPWDVLNGDTPAWFFRFAHERDAAYAEAYGIWLTQVDRAKPKEGQL